jgi:hypothetical protein
MSSAIGPSSTGHIFARKPASGSSRETTSERIEADLESFQAAGGVIEKLGTTHTLKKIDPDADPQSTTPQPVNITRRMPKGGGR